MVIATIGLANLFFSRTTGGYFDSVSDEMPLLHTWSLSVEEQFYFVWPLLLVLLFKVRSKRLDSLALKVLFGVSVISLALSQWFIHTGKAQCTLDRNPGLPAPQKSYVAFWGDSHAMAYFPMMEVFSEDRPVVTTLYGRGSTPPLANVKGFRIVDAHTTKLVVDYNQHVMAELARLTAERKYKNVSVIIRGRYLFYLGLTNISVWDKLSYADENRTKAGSLAVIRSGFEKMMAELDRAKVHKIIIFLPFPEFKYDIKRCLSRNIELCKTPRSVMEAYAEPISTLMKEVASRYGNVKLIDPLETFCTEETCPQVIQSRDGLIPVVFDDDHISHSGALHFGRKIESDLEWLVK